MEIHEYLRQKEKRLSKGMSRVRDFRVFDFNYIPEKPLMRQEFKPVIDRLLRSQKTGIANHLLIFGSWGSGKRLSECVGMFGPLATRSGRRWRRPSREEHARRIP